MSSERRIQNRPFRCGILATVVVPVVTALVLLGALAPPRASALPEPARPIQDWSQTKPLEEDYGRARLADDLAPPSAVSVAASETVRERPVLEMVMIRFLILRLFTNLLSR